jgi:hypothetical protein
MASEKELGGVMIWKRDGSARAIEDEAEKEGAHRADDENGSETDGDGKDDGSDEVDHDDELGGESEGQLRSFARASRPPTHLHGEAEGSTEVANEHELHEVVDGRVDPPSALGEEDGEGIGRNSPTPRLRAEHHLAIGEGAEEEGGEEAILAEEEEVLLVEGGDDRLRVLGDDLRLDEDGEPVAVVLLAGFEAVHGEATGEAGHSSED